MNKGGKISVPRGPEYQRSRGARQEQRILDALTDQAMTTYQLCDRLHLSRKNVCVHLERLMEKPNRRVHISGFDMAGGRPKFVYDIGDDPNMRTATFHKNRLLADLKAIDQPSSIDQAAARLSMAYNTARCYMNQLRKAGRVHVADWGWSDRTPVALYVAGPGENVPRPKHKPVVVPSAIDRRPSVFAALGL